MTPFLLCLAFGFVNPGRQANVDTYFLWQSAMRQSEQLAVTPYNNPATGIAAYESRYRYWREQIGFQERRALQYAADFENAERAYNARPTRENYNGMLQAHAAFLERYQSYQNTIGNAKRELEMGR